MNSSQRRKFKPPLKQQVTSEAEREQEKSVTTTPSLSLPPSQVHTLLSYCEGKESTVLSSRENTTSDTIRKKRMYQYSFAKGRKPEIAKNQIFRTKNMAHTAEHSHAADVYEFPLTPANTAVTAPMPTREQIRTKIQVGMYLYIASWT